MYPQKKNDRLNSYRLGVTYPVTVSCSLIRRARFVVEESLSGSRRNPGVVLNIRSLRRVRARRCGRTEYTHGRSSFRGYLAFGPWSHHTIGSVSSRPACSRSIRSRYSTTAPRRHGRQYRTSTPSSAGCTPTTTNAACGASSSRASSAS